MENSVGDHWFCSVQWNPAWWIKIAEKSCYSGDASVFKVFSMLYLLRFSIMEIFDSFFWSSWSIRYKCHEKFLNILVKSLLNHKWQKCFSNRLFLLSQRILVKNEDFDISYPGPNWRFCEFQELFMINKLHFRSLGQNLDELRTRKDPFDFYTSSIFKLKTL